MRACSSRLVSIDARKQLLSYPPSRNSARRHVVRLDHNERRRVVEDRQRCLSLAAGVRARKAGGDLLGKRSGKRGRISHRIEHAAVLGHWGEETGHWSNNFFLYLHSRHQRPVPTDLRVVAQHQCAVLPGRAPCRRHEDGVPPGRRRSTVEASDGGGGERATPAASDNG